MKAKMLELLKKYWPFLVVLLVGFAGGFWARGGKTPMKEQTQTKVAEKVQDKTETKVATKVDTATDAKTQENKNLDIHKVTTVVKNKKTGVITQTTTEDEHQANEKVQTAIQYVDRVQTVDKVQYVDRTVEKDVVHTLTPNKDVWMAGLHAGVNLQGLGQPQTFITGPFNFGAEVKHRLGQSPLWLGGYVHSSGQFGAAISASW